MTKTKKKEHKATLPAVDFDTWASEPSAQWKKPCRTCEYGDEVKIVIKNFMQKRADGKTNKRNSEFRKWLVQNFGYSYKQPTLNRHMRVCESVLYRQMRKTDIKLKLALGPAKMDHELGRR